MAFQKRNLLIVLGHGLRSDALDDSMSWPLSTPNCRKLMQHGIRMSATSACPADTGGMLSLLTGLHARQHGYVDQLNGHSSRAGTAMVSRGWPALLAREGYHVAGVGCVGAIQPWLREKVVVDPVESVQAKRCAYMTSVRAKGMDTAIRQQRDRRQKQGLFEPDRLVIDSSYDVDGFIAGRARTMLTGMPTDRPWALIVIFSGPGNDLPPPTLFEHIVSPQSLEEGFVPANLTNVDALAELDYPRVLLQRLNPQQVGRIRSDYLGRVSLIDYSIGRLMRIMGTRKDKAKTWAVLASDRGQLLGEHGLVGHRSFLTGAVEVPVIITPPGPVKQKVYPDLVGTVDVAATIAELGGCDLPKAVVGRSLLPVLAGGRLERRGWPGCVSEFGKRLMLETERYKAVFDTDRQEAIGIYDRLNDPDERDNLVNTPVGTNALDSLRGRLADFLLGIRALPGGGL